MKAVLYLLLLATLPAMAQIGVNTTNPTATLDVNGTMRVRTSNQVSRLSAPKDSLLVVDQSGNIVRVTSRAAVLSHFKSYVKGGFSSTGSVSIALSSNVAVAPFGYEEFDENNEYNPTTYTFTAANPGIYSINAQIKASAALSLTSNFGIAVLKNGVLVARSGFGNIAVVGVTVSPPIRNVSTLVKLIAGDTISFQIYADLINAGVTGAREDSFFSIAQEQ